jgi:hypothetical protein
MRSTSLGSGYIPVRTVRVCTWPCTSWLSVQDAARALNITKRNAACSALHSSYVALLFCRDQQQYRFTLQPRPSSGLRKYVHLSFPAVILGPYVFWSLNIIKQWNSGCQMFEHQTCLCRLCIASEFAFARKLGADKCRDMFVNVQFAVFVLLSAV